MKAIILAAGIGSRLRPLTDHCPKCLVEVNNKSILEKQIECLLEAGIEEVIVLAGYKKDQIIDRLKKFDELINYKVISNDDYLDTNNMYSLYLALQEVDGNILLMNGDVFFDPVIFKELLDNYKDHSLIASHKDSYDEESMKIVIDNDRIADISKQITEEKAYGNSIDLYLIKDSDRQTIHDHIKEIIEEEKNLKEWTEVAFQRLMQANKIHFKPHDIKGKGWVEIDNHDDLKRAEELFSNE